MLRHLLRQQPIDIKCSTNISKEEKHNNYLFIFIS
jgi:hypothetical protein